MRILHHIQLTPLSITAALSVLLLVGATGTRVVSILHANADARSVVAAAATPSATPEAHGADWQQEMTLLGIPTSIDPSATSPNDTIAMIGPMVTAQILGQYAGLTETGAFSSTTAAAAGAQIAPNVRAIITYKTYTENDLKTDSDTSYQRMLQYRSDLRTAFAPLLKNTDSEFELYGKYVDTGNPIYLTQLSAAADNYSLAASSTLAVVVPRDATAYHVAILNAMEEFAAVLDAMAGHGNDPIASAALLRSYDKAEQDMFNSFNNLSSYYSQKTP